MSGAAGPRRIRKPPAPTPTNSWTFSPRHADDPATTATLYASKELQVVPDLITSYSRAKHPVRSSIRWRILLIFSDAVLDRVAQSAFQPVELRHLRSVGVRLQCPDPSDGSVAAAAPSGASW